MLEEASRWWKAFCTHYRRVGGYQKPVFLTCNVTQESSNDIWFLDNECNNHMTGNKDLFSSLDTSIQSKAKLGNESKVKVWFLFILKMKKEGK